MSLAEERTSLSLGGASVNCADSNCLPRWQTAMPAVSYTAALQVISLIAVCQPHFEAEGWHFALLTIGFVSFAILINLCRFSDVKILHFSFADRDAVQSPSTDCHWLNL